MESFSIYHWLRTSYSQNHFASYKGKSLEDLIVMYMEIEVN